LFFLF
jgi:hypothetical protein